jgi:CHAT domain-containing protein/tetratricopeptide (TPR) repeat protein
MSASNARTLRRAVLPWLAPTGLMTIAVIYVEPALVRRGVPLAVRWPVIAAGVATLVTPPSLLLMARRSKDFAGVRYAFRPGALATGCASSWAAAQLVLKATGVPPFGGTAGIVVGTFVTWTATFQYAVETQPVLAERVLVVKDPKHAAELADRCETLLMSGDLSPEQTAVIEINLAAALIALSARSDHGDQLIRAFALTRTAAALAPELAFSAAERLVEGMRAKAARTGDDTGWDGGLEMLAETARTSAGERPEAPGLALAARAARSEWRARLARSEEERLVLLEQAMSMLAEAIKATPSQLDQHVLHTAELARLTADHPARGDLDDAIRQLGHAARRLVNADPRDRDTVRLALADLLMRRADAKPVNALGQALLDAVPDSRLRGPMERLVNRGDNDLIRAFRLYMSVSASDGRPEEARRRMPAARERMVEALFLLKLPEWSAKQTGWMYAKAAEELAGLQADGAAATALQWATWAEERGDIQQAAAAWWRWVTANADDLRRRVLQDKEPRIRAVQRLFTIAAERLVAAERFDDAAVALDLGRAVLLTERTGRDRAGLGRRLKVAGHVELAERWRAARARVEAADRAVFHVGAAGVHDLTDPEDGWDGSTEYRAMAEHDGLLREIAALPGFADVGAPATYATLQAAAAEGPLVYIVALHNRGFALVVGADDAAPAHVDLPRLDRAWADTAADQMRTVTRGAAAARVLGDLLPELWDVVLKPIFDVLPPKALVTLIPIGALADLPLHAATAAPGADGQWRDRVDGFALRYAPNARVLLQAQAAAASGKPERFRLLSVDGPGLSNAVAERESVLRLVPEQRRVQPTPATVENVMAALGDADVWHFSCHGHHDPSAPLESTLTLVDRSLRLRELFGLGRDDARLALLTACWSTPVDREQRDEVVGFPSALLQAGVAGVVSCQAVVEDEAACVLSPAFLSRVLDGIPPARALADALAWLRTKTNAELHDAFPEARPLPPDHVPLEEWLVHRPFARPWSWVLVNYTGA